MLDLPMLRFVLRNAATSLFDEVHNDCFVTKLRELPPKVRNEGLQDSTNALAQRATAAVNQMELG